MLQIWQNEKSAGPFSSKSYSPAQSRNPKRGYSQEMSLAELFDENIGSLPPNSMAYNQGKEPIILRMLQRPNRQSLGNGENHWPFEGRSQCSRAQLRKMDSLNNRVEARKKPTNTQLSVARFDERGLLVYLIIRQGHFRQESFEVVKPYL